MKHTTTNKTKQFTVFLAARRRIHRSVKNYLCRIGSHLNYHHLVDYTHCLIQTISSSSLVGFGISVGHLP